MQVQLGSKKKTFEVFSTQERSAIQLWQETTASAAFTSVYTLMALKEQIARKLTAEGFGQMRSQH